MADKKNFSALCSSDDDDSSSDSDSEFDFDDGQAGPGNLASIREPSRRISATANDNIGMHGPGKDSGRIDKIEHDNIYNAMHTTSSDFEHFLQHWHKLSAEKFQATRLRFPQFYRLLNIHFQARAEAESRRLRTASSKRKAKIQQLVSKRTIN